jgi:hypothetical protein
MSDEGSKEGVIKNETVKRVRKMSRRQFWNVLAVIDLKPTKLLVDKV